MRAELRGNRGAALGLVFAAIIMISLAIAGVISLTQHQRQEARFDAQKYEARLIAESGIALGLHPDISPIDEVLHQQFEPSGYLLDVTITSEQGRILASSVTDELVVQGLVELFTVWGLNPDDAQTAADSLSDWVDTDSEERVGGAENAYYASLNYDEYPRNGAFGSIEEMLLVRGMDVVAKTKPDWRDYFTLYGDGKIDINAADADVIAAFTGVHESDAQRFVEARNGADGVLGTEDDEVFSDESIEDATDMLNLSPERAQELSLLLTLEGSVLRIESKATVDNLEYTLAIIADRESGDQIARIAR